MNGTSAQAAPGLERVLDEGYDEVLARLPDVLKSEGFGVLTEIDVKDTLKKKLDVDFRRYRILGACNPPLAHQALSTELRVGLMMPCNVVVYEDGERRTVVMAIDPMQTFAAQDERLRGVAATVRAKLGAVLAKL